MFKKKKIVLFVLAIVLFHLNTIAQCAMCRAVLESEEGQSAAQGVNDGIVYLMAIPYLLLGGLGIVIYYKFFKKRKLHRLLY